MKAYNTVTQKWENITLDWVKETENTKKETKTMKKYYNEKGEEFKLYKGTISEIKNYHRRTNIYMAQDEETGKWYMTHAQGWIDWEGKKTWNIPINYYTEITKAGLADLCGYYFNTNDKKYINEIIVMNKKDYEDSIKYLEAKQEAAIKEIEEDDE